MPRCLEYLSRFVLACAKTLYTARCVLQSARRRGWRHFQLLGMNPRVCWGCVHYPRVIANLIKADHELGSEHCRSSTPPFGCHVRYHYSMKVQTKYAYRVPRFLSLCSSFFRPADTIKFRILSLYPRRMLRFVIFSRGNISNARDRGAGWYVLSQGCLLETTQ